MTLFVAKISSSPIAPAIGHLFGCEGFSSSMTIGGVDVATGVTVNVGSGCGVLVAVGMVVPVADGVIVSVGLGVKVGLGKLPTGNVDVGWERGVRELVGVKVKVLAGV
jgi:hypothetical protein